MPLIVLAAKGWSNEDSFMEFIKWFLWILDSKYKEKRANGAWAVLLVDRHSSRLNPDMLDYALRHRLHLVAYPTNTTSILQTLDVSVHGPFKKAVRKLIKQQDDAGTKLSTLTVVRDVIIPAWSESFTAENIRSGFVSTGIWPKNRDAIPRDKLAAAKLWDESDRKVEHKGSVFDFSSDAKSAPESKGTSDFDKFTLNAMPAELAAIVDVPVFGVGKKGKGVQRARLLTKESYIKKLKQRKGPAATESKADSTAPAPKKPASKPKAKARRKRKRRRKDYEPSSSDCTSESDISTATESDSEYSSDDDTPRPSNASQSSNNSNSLSLQPGVIGVPRSKQKPDKDYDYKSGEELKGSKSHAEPVDAKDGNKLDGLCGHCSNDVYKSGGHRICAVCETPFHLNCISNRRNPAGPPPWYCRTCRIVVPK